MQTKQFKLISIAVLAITLFSGQLFGMDTDNVRMGDFCDENNIIKAENSVALPNGTSFTLPIGITRDFLALSQDLWEHQIIPKILNGGNAVKALARLGRFSKTCREAKKIVHSDYTSKTIELSLCNDLIDNWNLLKMEYGPEKFQRNKGYRIEKDADGLYLKYANKKFNLSINKATYKKLENLLKALPPITFYNLQRALTFQASNPGQPIAIDLGFKNIGAGDARSIADVLMGENTTLETINLRDNYICIAGARAIAKALEKNTTLKTLNLILNRIGAEGAQAIAKALRVNITLTMIDLKWNNIGAEGAKAIADALRVNITLRRINLNCNHIDDEGAKAIAKALKENKTLEIIDLRGNFIGNEGARAIADALKENTTLKIINLKGNNINTATKNLLHTIAATKPEFELLI